MKSLIMIIVLCIAACSISQWMCGHASAKTLNEVYSQYNHNWDTVVKDYPIFEPVDTIIRVPVYQVNDTFISRLIDSFVAYGYMRSVMFTKSQVLPGYCVVTPGRDVNVDYAVDSLWGVARQIDNRKLYIYGVNDSILETFGIDKTKDSIYVHCMPWKLPTYGSNEDSYLFLCNRKRTDPDVRFKIHGFKSQRDLFFCKYFRWLFTDSLIRHPESPYGTE